MLDFPLESVHRCLNLQRIFIRWKQNFLVKYLSDFMVSRTKYNWSIRRSSRCCFVSVSSWTLTTKFTFSFSSLIWLMAFNIYLIRLCYLLFNIARCAAAIVRNPQAKLKILQYIIIPVFLMNRQLNLSFD